MTTNDEKNELLKTFKVIDTNNDGQLTKQELIEGFFLFFAKYEI